MRSGSVGLTTIALMAPETGLLGGILVLESKRIGPGPCSTQVGCENAGVWPAMLRATSIARAATIRSAAFTIKGGFVRLRIVSPPSVLVLAFPFPYLLHSGAARSGAETHIKN